MGRLLETLSILIYLVCLVVIALRAFHQGGMELTGLVTLSPTLVFVIVTTIGVLLLAAWWRRVQRRAHAGLFTALLGLPLLAGAAGAAWITGRGILHRLQGDDGDDQFYFTRAMSEDEAHGFALRLLATALSDQILGEHAPLTTAADLQVPAEWPLPEGFQFALVPEDDQAFALWSHRNSDTCRILLTPDWHTAGPDLGFTCDPPHPVPSAWSPVTRRPSTGPSPSEDNTPLLSPWPQYRLDPIRSAAVPDSSSAAPLWYSTLKGPTRATASVSGPFILIGTHATGVLEARDRTDGHLVWRAREPNWIHQDAVTDGRLVFVGFGDNDKSFKGAAPSGVSAHELLTGRRIWTHFTDNSVMTSPLVLNSLVVFGTAKGDLTGADKMTGETRWERHLPGNLVMGPPVVAGDTVIVPLDPRGVCSLDGDDGRIHWCVKLPPQAGSVGHISPTVAGGRVYGGSNAFPPSIPGLFQDFGVGALPRLWTWAITGENPIPARQRAYALDLATGSLHWESKLDGGDCCESPAQNGHMSGTPVTVPGDSSLVVVSPFSDRVYRLDEDTGAILARSEPIPVFPRGPALVVDSTVIAVDRQGVIHVLAVDDLHERCAVPLGEPVDRAGPTLAGGALLIAGRDGGLYSIPLDDVLRCDPTLSDRIARLREAAVTTG